MPRASGGVLVSTSCLGQSQPQFRVFPSSWRAGDNGRRRRPAWPASPAEHDGLERWRLQANDGRDGYSCELFDPLSNSEEFEMATDIFSNTQELLRVRSLAGLPARSPAGGAVWASPARFCPVRVLGNGMLYPLAPPSVRASTFRTRGRRTLRGTNNSPRRKHDPRRERQHAPRAENNVSGSASRQGRLRQGALERIVPAQRELRERRHAACTEAHTATTPTSWDSMYSMLLSAGCAQIRVNIPATVA